MVSLKSLSASSALMVSAMALEVPTGATAATRPHAVCNQLQHNLLAASAAEDWAALNSGSDEFLERCDQIVSPQVLSGTIYWQSISLQSMGRPDEALSKANDCIRRSYSAAMCHRRKAEILLAQGRVVEAKSSASAALRIAKLNFSLAESALARATAIDEREQAEIDLAQADQDLRGAKFILDELIPAHEASRAK